MGVVSLRLGRLGPLVATVIALLGSAALPAAAAALEPPPTVYGFEPGQPPITVTPNSCGGVVVQSGRNSSRSFRSGIAGSCGRPTVDIDVGASNSFAGLFARFFPFIPPGIATMPRSGARTTTADAPLDALALQATTDLQVTALDRRSRDRIAGPVTFPITDADWTPVTIAAPAGSIIELSLLAPAAGTADGAFGIDDVVYGPDRRPDTAITSGPPAVTSSQDADLGIADNSPGPADPYTVHCTLDGGPSFTCGPTVQLRGLPEGTHVLAAAATDSFGNVDASPATYSWRIDRTPPDTRIDAAPPPVSVVSDLVYRFSSPAADVAGFRCRLDGGAEAPCVSPVSYHNVRAGAHVFEVLAVDQAGNRDPTPARASTVVNLSPPVTRIRTGPPRRTHATTATFTFTANKPVVRFECKVDGGDWAACSGDARHVIGGLRPGAHTFRVRAMDAAGRFDRHPPARTWTILARRLPKATTVFATFERHVLPREFVLFRSVVARHLPAGTVIRATCRGRGCPRHRRRSWSTRRARASLDLTRWIRHRELRPPAKLTFAITKTGFRGIGKLYCVRHDQRVKIVQYVVGRRSPTCS